MASSDFNWVWFPSESQPAATPANKAQVPFRYFDVQIIASGKNKQYLQIKQGQVKCCTCSEVWALLHRLGHPVEYILMRDLRIAEKDFDAAGRLVTSRRLSQVQAWKPNPEAEPC